MCYYQQASYNIIISSYNSGVVVAKATTVRTFLKGDPMVIPLTFKPQVTEDTEYSVILVVSSFGVDLQAVTSFSKLLTKPLTIFIYLYLIVKTFHQR